MKKRLTLLCALLFCTIAHAQQRLVGTFAYYPHASTPEKDSSRILYREGNTTTGSERDYTAGRLLYDTIYTTGMKAAGTRLSTPVGGITMPIR
jgi:hypothetical protein